MHVNTTASTGDLTASGNVNLGGAGKTLGVFGTVNQFGASQNMVLGTNYTAGSDGFVLGTVNVTGACNTGQAIMYGYAGGGSASELRGVASVHAGCSGTDYATPYGSVFMLVRKGEVYKVDLSATGAQSSRATFTPIGR